MGGAEVDHPARSLHLRFEPLHILPLDFVLLEEDDVRCAFRECIPLLLKAGDVDALRSEELCSAPRCFPPLLESATVIF